MTSRTKLFLSTKQAVLKAVDPKIITISLLSLSYNVMIINHNTKCPHLVSGTK